MKVNHKELYQALQMLNKVADCKSSMAILGCIRISAADGKATLSTTDLTQWLQVEIDAVGELIACIPIRQLIKVVKGGKKKFNKRVEIFRSSAQEGSVTVVCNGTTSRVYTVDADDYPLPTEGEWKSLGVTAAQQLSEALAYTLPAISRDETRPHINCLYFDPNGSVISTDGHRCHLYSQAHQMTEALKLNLSTATVLDRFLKDSVEIYRASQNKLKIVSGNWTLFTSMVEEDFPPYQQILPKLSREETIVAVETAKFGAALAQVSTVLTKESPGVKITVNGVVSLDAADPEVGEAHTDVDTIENTHDSDEEDYVIGVNAKYLAEAVGADGVAMMHFGEDNLEPIRIDLDDRMAVIMPMRV